MADAPQYKKGQGPDQLPQGGAKELNDQVAATDAAAAQPVVQGAGQATPAANESEPAPAAAEATPAPHPLNDTVPLAAPDAPVTYVPQSEEDKFLFAPGEGNVTGAQPGASMVDGPLPVPPGITNWLPSLQLAAQDPSASPQTKALFRLISYHVNGAS